MNGEAPHPPHLQIVSEETRALRGEIESLRAFFASIEQRIILQLEQNEARKNALHQEFNLFQQALEQELQRLRQETLKERMAAELKTQEQIQEILKAVQATRQFQESVAKDSAASKEAIERLQAWVARPENVKDAALGELEQERKDLLQALKHRCEQLTLATRERLESEKKLEDSIAKLTLEMEGEREKTLRAISDAAELRAENRSLRAQLDLGRKSLEEGAACLVSLHEERDRLAQALLEETQKAKSLSAAQADDGSRWHRRLEQEHHAAQEEKSKRLELENLITELRAKLQAVTDHVARISQERGQTEDRSAQWLKEKEDLLRALRQKEELVSMLSATFKNLIAPGEQK
ncbi:MAG: hypothetical protein HY551_06545 [Elusimicrobia bacterium]|nr:hypothetical protein [Elusimicrobiota bacterium]